MISSVKDDIFGKCAAYPTIDRGANTNIFGKWIQRLADILLKTSGSQTSICKSPSSVSEAPDQGDAQHRGEFVSVASHAGETQTTPKTINTTGQKAAPPSNPAAEIEKLTLPQVQARLQKMNGMEATAQAAELEGELVRRWSKLDPIGAAKYAADAVAQGGDDMLLALAAAAWAKTDPIAASQWAATLDSPKARKQALAHFFIIWSRTNPAQAASAIATLPMGPDALHFIEHIMP